MNGPLEIQLTQEKLNKETAEVFRESRFQQYLYTVIKYTVGTLIKIIWVKEVTGIENIPKSGAILIASNHSSYFDFLSLISVAPRKIHYLAAEKFFSSAIWRPLMVATSQIKVERVSKNKETLHKVVSSAISQERAIGIFPEGTRSADDEIQKPFSGIAKYAVKHRVRVLPVGIIDTFKVMARHHKFPRPKKIVQIHIGEPIELSEYYEKECTDSDYEVMTHKIMIEVAKLAKKDYTHHLHE